MFRCGKLLFLGFIKWEVVFEEEVIKVNDRKLFFVRFVKLENGIFVIWLYRILLYLLFVYLIFLWI